MCRRCNVEHHLWPSNNIKERGLASVRADRRLGRRRLARRHWLDRLWQDLRADTQTDLLLVRARRVQFRQWNKLRRNQRKCLSVHLSVRPPARLSVRPSVHPSHNSLSPGHARYITTVSAHEPPVLQPQKPLTTSNERYNRLHSFAAEESELKEKRDRDF